MIGVQFHPESAATEYGYAMLDRFLHADPRGARVCRPAPTAWTARKAPCARRKPRRAGPAVGTAGPLVRPAAVELVR